ncbi:MAG: hypothetical protein IPH33_12550 [Bacteroidetes bacterium]|nr:hypothetical protein [Bacteroidota bacterium]
MDNPLRSLIESVRYSFQTDLIFLRFICKTISLTNESHLVFSATNKAGSLNEKVLQIKSSRCEIQFSTAFVIINPVTGGLTALF